MNKEKEIKKALETLMRENKIGHAVLISDEGNNFHSISEIKLEGYNKCGLVSLVSHIANKIANEAGIEINNNQN